MTLFDKESLEKNYLVELNRGNIPGSQALAVIALDDDVGPQYKDVWGEESNIILQTGVESLEIVSDDVNDTSLGSGVRAVQVISLDSNYIEQTQIVFTNGTTPVALTGTHIAVNSIISVDNGTAGQNGLAQGNIRVQVSGGGNSRGVIKSGEGYSTSSIYTVPAGKSAFFAEFTSFTPKGQDVQVRSRFQVGNTGPYFIGANVELYEDAISFPFKFFLGLPEKSTFLLQAKSTNSNIRITTAAQFIIVDEQLNTSISNFHSYIKI